MGEHATSTLPSLPNTVVVKSDTPKAEQPLDAQRVNDTIVALAPLKGSSSSSAPSPADAATSPSTTGNNNITDNNNTDTAAANALPETCLAATVSIETAQRRPQSESINTSAASAAVRPNTNSKPDTAVICILEANDKVSSTQTTAQPQAQAQTTADAPLQPKQTPVVSTCETAPEVPCSAEKGAENTVEKTAIPAAAAAPRPLLRGLASAPSCHVHAPTLEKLQSQSFSHFVRHSVLAKASRFLPEPTSDEAAKKEQEDDDPTKDYDSDDSRFLETKKFVPASDTPDRAHNTRKATRPPKWLQPEPSSDEGEESDNNCEQEEPEEEWTQGMAKVSLPDNFWSKEGICQDETGRGEHWQAGSALGDMTVEQPIQQNLRGLAGIYEYTFTVRPSMSLAAFRDKADEYRKVQVGSTVETTKELTTERVTALERIFWRRLGPTMPAAWYGADMEGSLFGDDEASGWSIGNLDSLLHILSRVPGVTSPYLYAGMWGSVFCAHTEDMNLLSINYLHAGAPKIWYAVAPGPDAERFAALAEFQYSVSSKECKEFLRHKRCLMSPKVLQKAGIRYTTTIQMPGEAVITFPGGYHFGFNTGFNVAEATNFGVPEWLSYGRRAQVCLCRPDSVRIDLRRLTTLLQRYNADRKKGSSLSWKAWSQQRDEKYFRTNEAQKSDGMGRSMASPLSNKDSPAKANSSSKKKKKSKAKLSEQQRKNEFYVEVHRAVPTGNKSAAAVAAKGKQKTQSKRKRKQIKEPVGEIWHLARPVGRRRLELNARILCIVAATAMGSNNTSKRKKKDVLEDEQCFAAQVVEISDDNDHVRVHLDGTPKTVDIWMHWKSPKLFLDGGRWSEQDEDETEGMPPRHYWKEADSKRLCA